MSSANSVRLHASPQRTTPVRQPLRASQSRSRMSSMISTSVTSAPTGRPTQYALDGIGACRHSQGPAGASDAAWK
jgi:hypothetical protein